MSVIIRLSKTGKRGTRSYRIVATEKRSRRDGVPRELLGFYSPTGGDANKVNMKRIAYWQSVGARLSPAVQKLLKQNP